MDKLDLILQQVKQLREDFESAVTSAKLNPKQITILKGVSDINNSLGVMRAGELLALSSGEDPQDADGTGTFISALGRLFGSKIYHIGGVDDGDLKWGANSVTGELEAGDGAVVLTEKGISLYNGTTEVGRLGNLSGFLHYVVDVYGFAIGTVDAYIAWDPDLGLQVIGASLTEGDGWTAAGVTWTPESSGGGRIRTASSVPAYAVGTKFKYTQDATTKYATVTSTEGAPAYNYNYVTMHSGSFTTNPITDPFYSALDSPDGW